MSSIGHILKEWYIRFMVWLGAAPPPGYEYLHRSETTFQTYTVKPGDTLFSIARKFGVHYNVITAVNNLESPTDIQSGQTLTIPPADWEAESASDTIAPPPEVEEVSAAQPEAGLEPVVETETETESPAGIEPVVEPPPVETEAPAEEEQEETIPVEPAADFGAEIPLPAEPPVDAGAPEEAFRYTVQQGDTISAIARKYGLTLRDLIEANDIVNPKLIFPGQKLVIPGYLKSLEPEGPSLPTPVANIKTAVGVDPDFMPIGPPDSIRGLYMSYFAVGHQESRQRIMDFLETTELNTVVVDVKGDDGFIGYPTQLPLAHEVGAARPTVKDFEALMRMLRERQIYTIARIVTFKDTPLARRKPAYALKTSHADGTTEIWRDNDQSGWVDPFLNPVWEYNIQIAVEAAQKGFNEILFDYVRFPTPSQVGIPYFSQEVSRETRVAAVTGFLSAARGQLMPFRSRVAANVFGYTCWRHDDTSIGQSIERIAQYVDVLCPMLYPSTFGSGIPGYKMAVAYPYEVVFESAKRAVDRLTQTGCVVRPWLQDFPDYRFDKRVYDRSEIQAQIKGCFDAGTQGFLMWNPHTRYTVGAYAPVS